MVAFCFCLFHSSKFVENLLYAAQVLDSELMEVEMNLPADLNSFGWSLSFKLAMM